MSFYRGDLPADYCYFSIKVSVGWLPVPVRKFPSELGGGFGWCGRRVLDKFTAECFHLKLERLALRLRTWSSVALDRVQIESKEIIGLDFSTWAWPGSVHVKSNFLYVIFGSDRVGLSFFRVTGQKNSLGRVAHDQVCLHWVLLHFWRLPTLDM